MASVQQTLEIIRACFRHGAVPTLVSGAGKGKTMLFEEIAQAEGMTFVPLQMSQLEPPDFVGLPHFPDHLKVVLPDGRQGRVHSLSHDGAYVVVGEEVLTVPVQDLKVLSYEPVTKHLRPDFLPPSNATNRGIILLDEINRARPDTRAAMFDFILYRRIIKYLLPPGWHLACAMNPAIDGYHVEELDSALADRLAFVRFEPTVEEWVDFEKGNGIADSVLRFIRRNKKQLDATESDFDLRQRPSRRSWSMVGRMETDTLIPEEIKLELYTGMVGSVAAVAYLRWNATDNKQLMKWPGFVLHPDAGIKSLKAMADKFPQNLKVNLDEMERTILDAPVTLGDLKLLARLVTELGLPDLTFQLVRSVFTRLRGDAGRVAEINMFRDCAVLKDALKAVR